MKSKKKKTKQIKNLSNSKKIRLFEQGKLKFYDGEKDITAEVELVGLTRIGINQVKNNKWSTSKIRLKKVLIYKGERLF